MLSLLLITAVFADFDDRSGENFETYVGTVHRSRTVLQLIKPDGQIRAMNRRGNLTIKVDKIMDSPTSSRTARLGKK